MKRCYIASRYPDDIPEDDHPAQAAQALAAATRICDFILARTTLGELREGGLTPAGVYDVSFFAMGTERRHEVRSFEQEDRVIPPRMD